ncbi:hypothetical protein Drorol1_Dr00027585 [Drosera rotundifolia]
MLMCQENLQQRFCPLSLVAGMDEGFCTDAEHFRSSRLLFLSLQRYWRRNGFDWEVLGSAVAARGSSETTVDECWFSVKKSDLFFVDCPCIVDDGFVIGCSVAAEQGS